MPTNETHHMTGPQHYKAAEEELATATNGSQTPESLAKHMGAAQVHATLALAAATAASGSSPAANHEPDWSKIVWNV